MAHYRIGETLYNADPTTWPNADVSAVQRALGCSLGKFMERLGDMDVDAIQALIWVLQRRTEPGLRIDQVQFTIRDYLANIVTTDEDVASTWPVLTADQRGPFLESLDAEQRDRLFVDGQLRAEPPVPLAGTATTGT